MTHSQENEHTPLTPIMIREAIKVIAPQYPALDSQLFICLHEDTTREDFSALKSPYHIFDGKSQRFIRHSGDVSLAFQQLYRSPVIIESLIPGQGYWTFGIVHKGRFISQGCIDVQWADDLHQFPMGLSVPGSLSEENMATVGDITQELIDYFSIPDGSIRLEWIHAEKFHLRHLSTDVADSSVPNDFVEIIEGFDGEEYKTPSPAAAIQWLYSRSGIVESLDGIDEAVEIEGVKVLTLNLEVGERIGHVLDVVSRDALGYVIAVGETSQEAIATAKRAVEMIDITTQTMI